MHDIIPLEGKVVVSHNLKNKTCMYKETDFH